MAAIVSAATRAVNISYDAFNFIESVNKVRQGFQRGNRNYLEIAKAIHRLVLLGFSCAEVNALANGAKNEKLAFLKGGEFIPRLIDLPVRFVEEFSTLDSDPEDPGRLKKIIRICEKGLVEPAADIFRIGFECVNYQERAYLDAIKKDPQSQRPIYEWELDSDGNYHCREIGHKTIDPSECKENMQCAVKNIQIATTIRTAACLGTAEIALSVYERLAEFISSHNHHASAQDLHAPAQDLHAPAQDLHAPAQDLHAPAQDLHAPAYDREDFNLLALSRIPDPLHEDVVFSRYICPITGEPIRDPVRDTNGITVYERAAISEWLQINPVSPVTRRPMTVRDLQEMPALRAIIDHRLQQHQEALVRFLAQQRLPE